MIRMIQSRSSAHAKAYFQDALSKSDYYVSDQELAGVWQGQLATRMGLSGFVDKEAFFDLCDNRHPGKNEAVTPLTREGRTTGYDINFHCPKSVSVLHALSGDEHILDAFRDSVTETMKTIEADGKTRVRMGGKYEDRDTREFVWAHFVHQTARPVEGALPDPHLHSHCFVFNATWDGTENRIKAGQFRDIKRDMPYYQARFHKTLSDKLSYLGYGIRRTDKSFEIDGVPQKVLDLFSKRTDEIGRIAKEKGITDAKELDGLGAKTRAKKQKGNSMDDLKKEWQAQIGALGKDGQSEKTVRYGAQDMPVVTPEQCIDHAVSHCFVRASVMPHRRFLTVAYRHGIGMGDVTLKGIDRSFENDHRLINITEKSGPVCTTKEVLKEEEQMVRLARQGIGKLVPAYAQAPELSLHGQQAAAVEHVLTTTHRVSIIRGAAGAGKTTLMTEAVEKFKEAEKWVFVVAPSTQASRGVLREAGFKEAETVATFLGNKKMQERIKGHVLWVDEAGLLGTKDMRDLLQVVTEQNAQLILGGDTRQHASVVRGDALRILNTEAGIKTAEVSKIYRQEKKEFREVIEDLSKGEVAKAFQKLDDMKFIQEVDPLKVSEMLVNDYIDARKRGRSAMVICPTHAQGEEITDAIRARLKKEGMLGKKEIEQSILKPLNFTDAEKADSRNFRDGQIVKFTQNVRGFMRGSYWTVSLSADNEVMLDNGNGEKKALPKDKPDSYAVFRQDNIALSKGDKVLITDNSFDFANKRLDNGTLLSVKSVSKSGMILLQNDISKNLYTIDKNFGHIAHAHCITSQAAQGKTIDEVFIYQPAATFPATDAKQLYVSFSRAKFCARLYTDNKAELLQHASDLGERQSAIEAVGNKKLWKEFREAQQRQEVKQQPSMNPTKGRDYEPDR
jgi:conjugative relaxase-like TrwC/TraI family protein